MTFNRGSLCKIFRKFNKNLKKTDEQTKPQPLKTTRVFCKTAID